jgi:hypothetical protein
MVNYSGLWGRVKALILGSEKRKRGISKVSDGEEETRK